MKEEEKYIFGWSLIPYVGYKRFKAILSYFGDPKKAWSEFVNKDVFPSGFSALLTKKIKNFVLKTDIDKEIDKVTKKGIRIITFSSPDYPMLLKNTSSPPLVLYIRGELPDGNYISVVGTRKPSIYGINIAEKISKELSEYNVTVVSGMARGIDTYAHRATLRSRGKTVAVLGTGVDVVYPYENKKLYQEIIENGAVISEYPPGIGPKREHFPRRNRIIAGVSLGTLVVEAPEKSGALITARFALEEGREVFAVPGQIDSRNFVGTNRLIRDGAKLVENARNIIEEFPFINWDRRSEMEDGQKNLRNKEEIIYKIINEEPKYIDIIAEESGIPIREVTSILLSLELKRLIKEIGGKRYCRIK